MKIKFNEGSKLVDKIVFPNDKISITNTVDEIKMFCPNNELLTDVSGGRITSHYGAYMFYGDKNLKNFTTSLIGIVSAESMFEGCSSLTTMNVPMDNLRTASEQTSFYDTTKGGGTFKNCTNLESVNIGPLENLYNGTMMFLSCTSLKSLTGSLNSLIYGEGMFYGCTGLTEVSLGGLKSLKYAKSMFSNTSIKSFSADTESLESVKYMFFKCSGLTSCNIILNKVTDTQCIFNECTSLRNLSVGDLNADLNLSACPLTLNSISGIATSAKEGNHTIRISDYTKNLSKFSTVANIFTSKGWKIV